MPTRLPAGEVGGRFHDGVTAFDHTGPAVATGDVNGDGKLDLVIGAFTASYNSKSGSGSVYVYPGHASPWTSPYNLGNLCPGC
jgi:hypothetical protein